MIQRAAPRRSATSLKGKALQWLSQREHSRLELARKLTRWQRTQNARPGSPSEAVLEEAEPEEPAESCASNALVNEVLDELAHAGLVSDERFAQSRLHLRQARFGNRRIEQELKQHGLAPTSEQKDELRSSEVERALVVLRARYPWPPPEALALKQQQQCQRFLAGRGFTSEAIRQALRQLSRPGNDNG